MKCQWKEQGRSTVDIKATTEKNRELFNDLAAAHILSGCDTVAFLWGIGKVTVVKAIRAGHKLRKFGYVDAEAKDVLAEATSFVAACYGSKLTTDMSSVRYEVWTSKM